MPPLSLERMLTGTPLDSTAHPESATDNTSISFRILDEIGRGGMGIVYQAQQIFPPRTVALKVMQGTFADAQGRKRFAREISILARLNHRGIAKLFVAGELSENPGGALPFMAMEFVRGVPLTTFAHDHHLSTRQRVELIAKVCDVVAYAHQEGVIHRDLKPSNILVEAGGEPKVLDFGLASMPTDTTRTMVTVRGEMVGTLDYMSPEQAEGRISEIDARSDVYSLGIIFYELLATHRPFDLSHVSVVDAVRTIRDSAPPRLSGVSRAFRGDLHTIVHKALCKEQSGRYASVKALAEDLRRWLAYEPILARRPSAAYRARRFIRRHRLLVTAVSLIILSLLVGLVLTTLQAARANREAARANNEAARANEETVRANQQADNLRNALEQVQQEKKNVELQLAGTWLAQAQGLSHEFLYSQARQKIDDAWSLFQRNDHSTLLAELAAWNLDLVCGQLVGNLNARNVAEFRISPNGAYCALQLNDGAGTVEVRNLLSQATIVRFTAPSRATRIAFSPDSNLIFCATSTQAEVWSIHPPRRLSTAGLDNPVLATIQLDNDPTLSYMTMGGHLRTQSLDGSSPRRDVNVGSQAIRALAVGDFGALLVDREWRIRKLAPGSDTLTDLGQLPPGTDGPVCISPAAKSIAVLRGHDSLVWDVASRRTTSLALNAGWYPTFGFSAEDSVYALSDDGKLLFNTDLQGHRLRAIPVSTGSHVAVADDMALVLDPATPLALWSLALLPETRLLLSGGSRPLGCTLSSDGCVAALAADAGKVILVDTLGGHTLATLDVGSNAKFLAFDDELAVLAIATTSNRLQMWDLATCTMGQEVDTGPIGGLALSKRGDLAIVDLFASSRVGLCRRVAANWKLSTLPHPGHVNGMDIAADSSCFRLFDDAANCEVWTTQDPPQRDPSVPASSAFGRSLLRIYALHQMDVLDTWGHSTGKLPGLDSSAVDAAVSGDSSRAAAVGSNELYLFGLDPNALLHQVPLDRLPLKSIQKIALNATGSRMLLASKAGVLFVDLGIPACVHQAGGALISTDDAEDGIQNARRLAGAGLARQAFSVYRFQHDLILAAPSIYDAQVYWAMGDLPAVRRAVEIAPGLAAGTRRLLVAATKSGAGN